MLICLNLNKNMLPPNIKNTPCHPNLRSNADDIIGRIATPTPEPLIANPVASALFFSK